MPLQGHGYATSGTTATLASPTRSTPLPPPTEIHVSRHEAAFAEGQKRLFAKLKAADVSRLPISDYTKRYLSDQLRSAAYLGTFAQVLSTATSAWDADLGSIRMVELGGGTGLQTLLALESGVGHITYSDIYDVSCSDVHEVARAVGLEIPAVICADTEGLVAQLNSDPSDVDVVVSYDVLEHIYDVPSHLRAMNGLRYPTLNLLYASGANGYNPRYSRQVKKIQISVETEPQPEEFGHKDRDSLRPYMDLRREVVRAAAPDLSDSVVDDLAARSRGLIVGDIERLVVEPYRAGLPTFFPAHPTNTCDPLTGNWCEQLLDFDRLRVMAEQAGLRATFGFGRYALAGTVGQDTVRRSLNAAMTMLGKNGIRLAPYYFVELHRR